MPATADGRFPTTDWTLISRLRSRDAVVSRRALDELCIQYHYPLYYFIRRRGLEHHDAQDALQDFLIMLLRRDAFEDVRAEAGRLRGFLSTALKRFLLNWFRDHAKERRTVSLEAEREMAEAEGRFLKERLVEVDTPERVFERKWAVELLRHVQRKLRAQYAQTDKLDLYSALRPGLISGGTLRGHDTPGIAASLGMTEGAVRTAMSHLLHDFREILWQEVAQTVANAAEVEDEIAYLLSVFRQS